MVAGAVSDLNRDGGFIGKGALGFGAVVPSREAVLVISLGLVASAGLPVHFRLIEAHSSGKREK